LAKLAADSDRMNSSLVFGIIALYFSILLVISFFTSRGATSHTFFLANRQSRWWVVAFGMIGTSLSGVTFMSVPGFVGSTQFSYMAIVFGYFVGYIIIATVLMPLYYRLNLTSIYGYLEQRFGFWSYKTGAFFFIVSRSLGAAFRMFLVVNVLQIFVFNDWGVPFWATVVVFIVLVILYTFQGGVKTIVWTDSLQTTCMLLAVILTIILISDQMGWSFSDLYTSVRQSDMSQMFFWGDWSDSRNFLKQFLSGIFIAVTMTGLDQEMMQKNLSCKTLGEAKKNMFTFSFILVLVNLMFLVLGVILYMFANAKGIAIPEMTDDLFPTLALNYLGPAVGIIFLIGLISAAFPSADGALTSLTTSFCVDFLNVKKRNLEEKQLKRIRYTVHFSFALILLAIIIVFQAINDQAVISKLLTVAGYTYGPLLGLYAFGLFSKKGIRDNWVPLAALMSPVICYLLKMFEKDLLGGYTLGYELLIVNGLLTYAFLFALSRKGKQNPSAS
jgi:SSS family transporter